MNHNYIVVFSVYLHLGFISKLLFTLCGIYFCFTPFSDVSKKYILIKNIYKYIADHFCPIF